MIGDNGDIVIVTSAVSTVSVSSTMMSVAVTVVTVMVVIVRSGNERCQSLFLFHLASGNDPHTIVSVARLDVDRSTMSVTVTILVDDSVGVLSVVTNDVDLGRVSLVMMAVVVIDNDSLAMTSAGDDGSIVVPVSTSLNDGRLVVVASSVEERLDLFHDRLSLGNFDQLYRQLACYREARAFTLLCPCLPCPPCPCRPRCLRSIASSSSSSSSGSGSSTGSSSTGSSSTGASGSGSGSGAGSGAGAGAGSGSGAGGGAGIGAGAGTGAGAGGGAGAGAGAGGGAGRGALTGFFSPL